MRGLPRQETGGADLFHFPSDLGAELATVDNSTPSLCGTTTTATIDPHTVCRNQPLATRVPAHVTNIMISYI